MLGYGLVIIVGHGFNATEHGQQANDTLGPT
jgi:hypothetical protein